MKSSVLWTEKGHYFSRLIYSPIILLIARKNIPEHVSAYPQKKIDCLKAQAPLNYTFILKRFLCGCDMKLYF